MPVLVWFSLAVLVVFVLVASGGALLPLPDPYAQDIMRSLELPQRGHWFGTDQLGRDVLARIVEGSRYSLLIGLGAVAAGVILGTPFGIVAGYFRGWLDAVFTRVIDVFLAFPGIILALTVVAILGPGIGSLIVAVSVRSFPVFARVARAETLSLRGREFVQGAQAVGSSPLRIMLRHLFPNMVGQIMVIASLQMATAILIGATLTFLGVGLSPEVPEWGAMMNAGRAYMLRAPQLILVPGLALMLVMMALNVLGDYIRDRFDPYARQQHG